MPCLVTEEKHSTGKENDIHILKQQASVCTPSYLCVADNAAQQRDRECRQRWALQSSFSPTKSAETGALLPAPYCLLLPHLPKAERESSECELL